MKKTGYMLFIREARKHLRNHTRISKRISFEEAKHILLLFNSDLTETNHSISEIIQTLEKEGKEVYAVGYLPSNKLSDNVIPGIKILNKKDTKLHNKPKERIIQDIRSRQFDILIDLTLENTVPLLYLTLYADIPLKAGTHLTEGIPLYDFILNADKLNVDDTLVKNDMNEHFLFNEIIFYLKSIRTTN